jgi:hypothetical protein
MSTKKIEKLQVNLHFVKPQEDGRKLECMLTLTDVKEQT